MSSFSCPQNNPKTKTAKSKTAKPNTSHSRQFSQTKANIVKVNTAKVHNRIRALMEHTTRYAFKGEARLAADSGVSKSALNRLLNGHSSPSFALVALLTKALEKQLSKGSVPKTLDLLRIDPRDLVSLDGTYPTPSVCALAGCRGCLPTAAYDENEVVKPEYRDTKPGQWALSKPATLPPVSPPLPSHPTRLERAQPNATQLKRLPSLLVPVEIFADDENPDGERLGKETP